jgi:dsRNA-specific ribonuclease
MSPDDILPGAPERYPGVYFLEDLSSGEEEVLHVDAQNQLLNNIDLMMEARTAPNANRNYDYERLEFYGDSVISFLVILELFLTKEYDYKEGHLDFYRI